MKIDRSKLKKSTSEVPADCKNLIEKLKGCSQDQFLAELRTIETWTYGKCELYHWIDILDLCDDILESATVRSPGSWVLACDQPGPGAKHLKELVLWTLHFTTLLIEHSFSRHLYSSMEHLSLLLSSFDLDVVLAVLNLLYMFSKRSNFISRLAPDKRALLLTRLSHLAASWGGKDNGFGLSVCCSDEPISAFPPSATTLHFEFYAEVDKGEEGKGGVKKGQASSVTVIHVEGLDKMEKTPAKIMEDLLEQFSVPEEKQMLLFTYVRLAHGFSDYKTRLKSVQARLQALSVLIYSNQLTDSIQSLLYSGLLEELVDVLEMKGDHLMEIKAAALKSLTSIIHLDRNPNFPKLNTIIDVTGAASYHGFLPVMVRNCISSLTGGVTTPPMPLPPANTQPFPQPLATALFSFLYHLASYEAGGEALVSCGMMESLLKVIQWPSSELEHITFVTRAVRVIDLITNLDMASFQTHTGLNTFIARLQSEVDTCRLHQPFQISIERNTQDRLTTAMEQAETIHDPALLEAQQQVEIERQQQQDAADAAELRPDSSMEVDQDQEYVEPASPKQSPTLSSPLTAPKPGVTCLPQRAALLKSMLNFLKKAIQDPAFSDSIRHVMDGSLPNSLKHIISNAEYYGPSLFLLATDVVTAYVFQEPSLLSSLQDKGLTDVVLHALLVKDVPATREVLASLPNVFSALCLNTRGLEAFVECKPFERLFKVLLSPDYLPAMRRRRSADPLGDTATNLGNAMDELMRHQPSLKQSATAAIIKLLEQVCALGRDPRYVCWKPASSKESSVASSNGAHLPLTRGGGGEASSDEEEEEEDNGGETGTADPLPAPSPSPEKEPVPLVDYVLNVMKFVDAILSNNSTDDHCREFVSQKGLVPLMGILGLPNLPIDFPAQPACQAVGAVCKSILNLAHEPQVLKQGLLHLNDVLKQLEPLHTAVPPPGGSVLLRELVSSPNIAEATASPSSTPLLHHMSAAHAYIQMFVHVCRTGQADIRTISVSHWGSELGLSVLSGLSRLYTSLVWESTVLLALCSEDTLPQDCMFGRQDMEKLVPADQSPSSPASHGSSGEVTSAMENLTTDSNMEPEVVMEGTSDMEVVQGQDEKKTNPLLQCQIKQIKPLLSGSSRLGRALAELFGLLVKLCVGSPLRQRRGQVNQPTPAMPSPPARAVATALTKLLTSGLSWEPPATSPLPKFRLTFFICSVGFTSPMLFDEKKFPYHLMLMKFLSSGGQQAFFNTFNWAITLGNSVPAEEGLESPSLPDGTGEFLDAWLMLLEKMVNPKTVNESPHVLPSKASGNFKPFDSLRYLIKTHKMAFEAVMMIWGRKPLPVYGGRMAESVLAILCHILKGEKIIAERLEKEKPVPSTTTEKGPEGTADPPTPAPGVVAEPNWSASTPAEPDVNPEHLQTLMDMGFPRERCVEAITAVGGSLDAATDYLLNNPLPPLQQSLAAGFGPGGEQDDLMRAIAMSLGENVMVSTDGAEAGTQQGENKDAEQQKEEEEEMSSDEQEALKQQVIDTFTDSALTGCLTLLDTLPETVYRVTDLLMAIFNRNGREFKEKLLTQLMAEVKKSVEELLAVAHSGQVAVKEAPESARAAVRIHLFTLLFEDCSRLCVQLVESSGAIELMVQLIAVAQEALQGAPVEGRETPKWITPMLLFIDLYEKVVLAMKRRDAMASICSHNWKWFDVGAGKWQGYQPGNNKTINDAFWAGEASVKFTTGRRKYNIQFGAMMQANEETGNRRPLMISLKRDEKDADSAVERRGRWKKEDSIAAPGDKKEEEGKEETTVETAVASSTETSPVEPEKMETSQTDTEKQETIDSNAAKSVPPLHTTYKCSGLTPEQSQGLLRAAVGLISVPVEPDALNAILRLCLRLTRTFAQATLFAELGGIKLLLALTQASSFSGFSSLASLLVRHVLEDDHTLKHTMEKIIRSSAATSTAATTKELHYLLRSLAPAACRQMDTFTSVARDILRVDISLLSKRGEPEDDHRLLVKSLPGKASAPAPPLQDVSKSVISDLLDFLVQSDPEEPVESDQPDVASKSDETIELPTSVASILSSATGGSTRGPTVVRQISSELIPGEKREEVVKDGKETKEIEDARKRRHLLPKSAVCRLLAEMVKSYAGCARLITEHVYPAGISDVVKEDCSALAFILDELLTSTTDKESATLVKMLVAALASCNHAPEAQTSLVTEVKNALTRALSLPECSMKHTKVQSLTGLISTMIENCPASVATNQPPFKSGQVNMNNIVKCMVKRGLITDLARVSHALDLSSPSMAATVNAALKPLETLSRIVNQPTGLLPPTQSKAKPKNDESRASEANNGNTNTTNSEATRAQNEEIAGIDNEATEHDVSTTAESMDPNSESQLHTVEEGDGEDFDEMMEQLLEQDRGEGTLLEVAVITRGENGQNMETDDTINDSQMMSQEESFVEGEGGGEEDSDTDSSHSQETEGSGAEEDEMEENDDEDEGEEDEDDEDDDDDAGSDVYDDEQDEFQDLEDAFFRMPGTAGTTAERDQENVMMIGHVNDDPLLDDRAISLPLWGDMTAGEGTSAADNLANNGAAGPSGVAPSHPLLMGRSEAVVPAGSARGQGRSLTRQRGFRYIQLNPRNGGGVPGTPAILQSLLGHNSGRDFLQLTGNHPGLNVGAMRDATRVLVMDSGSGFAILDSLEDEIPGLEGLGQGGGSALSTVPNALVRWTEESRVLDGDSLHDCMTVCKPELLDVIEKHREEELTERKEKKKKLLEEEETRKKKEDEERKKKEPEAATTPAPESAGQTAGSADEMDVVVSENAAVHSAVDTIASSTGSITDTAHRLAEDLANAISNRVTSFPNMSGQQPVSTTAAQDTQPQFTFQSAGGLLSSLQDLLPTQGQDTIPPASLSSVLQTLHSSYQNTGAGTGGSTDATNLLNQVTSAETASALPPTFHFATPPPLFPTLPIAPPTLSTESGPASLPDALGPLSPSPDQEAQPTEPLLDTQDVSMASEPDVDVERLEPADPVQPLTAPEHAPVVIPALAGSSGTSTGRESDFSAILGDLDIPEGVDPSFLAALPEDMRREVIEEQRRLVRARQQPPPQPAAGAAAAQGMQEVNPEFLAALPPNIQEEVLAQQRLEQQRQNAAQADPTAPVDPGEFLQTLPPSLRQSLLADMEESQISALPADLAAEAQNLRRDYEQRNRQMMHERFFNHVNHTGPNLSSILRNTVNRLGSHYAIHSGAGGPGRSNLWRSIGRGGPGHQQSAAALAAANNVKFRGRQLLDHEGLSCLLILLFIDDAKLNTTRLHRILRNLCYHAPTRDWVVKCLLSILEKANTGTETPTQQTVVDPAASGPNTPTPAKMRKSMSKNSEMKDNRSSGQTSWLNISMDAALGFRANVFQVQRSQQTGGKKSSSGSLASIAVHPQAAPVVCRHTLEVLISLAKSFPIHFLPGAGASSSSMPPPSDSSTPSDKKTSKPAEFWETLLKLDRECWTSKKGKSVVRSHSSVSIKSEDDEAGSSALSFSAFGQLLSMLASPVIKRSSLLTDKLLRLLSLISLGQPDVLKRLDDPVRQEENAEGGLLVDKAVKEDQIQLAVEVLTSKACSEEGLEDVTALLLNLSYGGSQTRESILHLLLAGARQLGNVVSAHVSDLLTELAELKASGGLASLPKEEEEEGKQKGVMADRFTKEAVVLTAPTKPKGGGELQLSSMTALTNKTSSQSFFLRVLKVIIQLREAALLAIKKAQKAKKDAEAKKKEADAIANLLEHKEPEAAKEDSSSSSETPKDSSTPSDTAADMDVGASVAPANATTQAPPPTTTPMEVELDMPECLDSLSDQLTLTELWATLSNCLKELADTPDHHAVLVLQPTVEAFFLVHAAVISSEEKKKPNQKETRKEQLAHIEEKEGQLESEQAPQTVVGSEEEILPDTQKFLAFAETHRTVLNQILRQSTTHLADGPFSVLVDHTRVLDFDIKRRFFRTELERLDEGIRREDLAVHVRRDAVFEESFRELHRRSAEEWKNRFYIVFEGEEGQDAGGLLREWYVIISREIFNPNYALFKSSPGDRVTYTINDFSHINSNHLCYFKFVGRVIAKAIYDNKLLECYFTRSFYKHILAKLVKHQDMESEDYEFYKGLDFLLENKVSDLGYDLTFSTEIQEFGVTEVRDLIPDGRNVIVTDQNKADYIRLVCQMKMTGAIRKQLAAFLEGFYDIIPRRLIAIFNEQELELLLSGLPDINIDDLKANTEYHKYSVTSLQIVWFWRALRSFDQTDRAKFLQFVTGSSKVPLQGFGALEGMNGAQKFQIHRDDRSTDRLPAAHTCFNQLDLPAYETYDKLRTYLLKAIQECSEGFGFA
eukprot:GFUD01044951.1.p1 GENE.GFUD01044951.1~~GFUD01044951.1.p1  ORF type:complete len:4316 (+),score=1501.53 GFUD01044951.1:136-13083(+)